jgi:hypothetical protein
VVMFLRSKVPPVPYHFGEVVHERSMGRWVFSQLNWENTDHCINHGLAQHGGSDLP